MYATAPAAAASIDARYRAAQFADRVDAVHVGERQVDEHDVGSVRLRRRDPVTGAGTRRDDLDVVTVLQEPSVQVAKLRVVVDEHDSGRPDALTVGLEVGE
jgi:hypothetical protein